MKRSWLLTLALSSVLTFGGAICNSGSTQAQDATESSSQEKTETQEKTEEDKPAEKQDKPAEEKPAETQEKPAEEKAAEAEEKPAEEEMKQEEKPAEEAEKPAEQPQEETEKPADSAAAETQEGELQMTVESTDLYNPCGIAIQPETNTLFIADSGNHRIVRMVEGKLEEVVVEFPEDIYGKGPQYAVGPLGMCFLDKDTLVVGGGGMKDGEELLRVYKVPAAGEAAIKADQMENSMAMPAEGDVVGEGNFYAVAATETGVYVTLNGDDAKGWVGKATREGNSLKDFTRFIATKEATGVDAPVGICTLQGGHLVVGQMGEITVPGDSLLTFYTEAEGKEVGNFKTGLSDITAVGYSAAGHLYALDFSWHDTTKGGLFRLVAEGEDGCIAKPMMTLDKPTSMVFDQDGNLWVTVIGTAEGEAKGGQLIKISGLPNGR